MGSAATVIFQGPALFVPQAGAEALLAADVYSVQTSLNAVQESLLLDGVEEAAVLEMVLLVDQFREALNREEVVTAAELKKLIAGKIGQISSQTWSKANFRIIAHRKISLFGDFLRFRREVQHTFKPKRKEPVQLQVVTAARNRLIPPRAFPSPAGSASPPQPPTEGSNDLQQGTRLAEAGRLAEAAMAYQRAAQQFDLVQDWAQAALASRRQGEVLEKIQRLPAALQAYSRALQYYFQASDENNVIVLLEIRGNLIEFHGLNSDFFSHAPGALVGFSLNDQAFQSKAKQRWNQAKELLGRAAVLFNQISFYAVAGHLKLHVGDIEMEQGRFVEAMVSYARAADFSNKSVEIALHLRSEALRQAAGNDGQRMLQLLEATARIHHRSREGRWEGADRKSRAKILVQMGRLPEAAREYEKAAVAFKTANNPRELIRTYQKLSQILGSLMEWDRFADVLGELAEAYRGSNKVRRAREIEDQRALALEKAGRFQSSLKLWKRIVEQEMGRHAFESAAKTYLAMGRLYRKLGKNRASGKAYQEAARLYLRLDQTLREVIALGMSRLAYESAGRRDLAQRAWGMALKIAGSLGLNPSTEGGVYALMGDMLEETEEYALAAQMYEKAFLLLEEIGDSERSHVLERLGVTALQAGQFGKAREALRRVLELYKTESDGESAVRVKKALDGINHIH